MNILAIIYLFVISLIFFPSLALTNSYEEQGTYLADKNKAALHSVYFCDENNGWAVGYQGNVKTSDDTINDNVAYILKTTDGGKNWQDITPKKILEKGKWVFWMGERLYKVFFIDKDNGWVIGTHRTIAKTSDGGNSWSKIDFQAEEDRTKGHEVWRDIFIYQEGDAYKGFLAGGRYKNTDYNYQDVDNGYVHEGFLYRYVDDNKKDNNKIDLTEVNVFKEKRYKHLTSLSISLVNGHKDVWVTGYNYEGKNDVDNFGLVYFSDDGGVTWKEVSPKKKGHSGKDYSLACYNSIALSSYNAWVVGTDNTILLSSDYGNSWKNQNYEKKLSQENLNKIFLVTNNLGYAAGNRGNLYLTLNGGETWEKDKDISLKYCDKEFQGIHFPTLTKGWIIGEGEVEGKNITILKYLQSEEIYSNQEKVVIYPNPFIPNDYLEKTGSYNSGITIENLFPYSSIKIFTTSGEFVKELSLADAYGRIIWKVDSSISSGLYLLAGKSKNNKKTLGKVVIIK
ncbi:hypothetical protein KKB84_04880 [bacterium]|nr:hypothetical protein [bacterium]MBU1153291.1 hypothetical protein [bacterium]MBU1782356.1 hypothetical protein [bacterium]